MQPMRTLTLIACALLAMKPLTAGAGDTGGVAVIGLPDAAVELSIERNPTFAQGRGMTLSEAVEQVRRRYNGRIISAETKRSGNREVHHIKVLTQDNKVKTVKIPGRTLSSRG